MSYRVIYLDGKNGLPNQECKICKRLDNDNLPPRNVVEPVAIFVKEEDYSRVKNKLIEIEQTISDSEEKEKAIEELVEELSKAQNGKTCIFHCEKENDIWIENFDNYLKWKKEREEYTDGEKEKGESFKIQWNGSLVKEFWSKIRAYRFAIDYFHKFNDGYRNWDTFISYIFFPDFDKSEEQKQKDEILKTELEKNKLWILFNFEKLLSNYTDPLINSPNEYDFQNFIFPPFEHLLEQKILNPSNNYNFWYIYEDFSFHKKANFIGSTFLGKVEFINVSFENNVNFSFSQFFQDAVFYLSKFYSKATFENFTFRKQFELNNIESTSSIEFKFINKEITTGKLILSGIKNKETIIISDCSFEELHLSGIATIKSTESINKPINIPSFTTYYPQFHHFPSEQNSEKLLLTITNVTSCKLCFDSINTSSTFPITMLIRDVYLERINKAESVLEIKNCILENTIFSNCDFSKANKIEFTNVLFIDTIFIILIGEKSMKIGYVKNY